MMLSKEQEKILEKARKTYGARNQLAVAAEECNELAIAVLKFMRYDDKHIGVRKTKENVLEERADVEIILNHIDAIYGFTEEQIKSAIWGKISRLKNWLEKTEDLSYSMEERDIPEKKCEGCFYYDHPEEAFDLGVCQECKA